VSGGSIGRLSFRKNSSPSGALMGVNTREFALSLVICKCKGTRRSRGEARRLASTLNPPQIHSPTL